MASKPKTSIVRSRDNICKFCKKGFSSERTLAAHMCVKKRRFADKDAPGSMLGYRVFQRFYELTSRKSEPKSVYEFIDSSHYNAFVKFARYMVDLNPLVPDQFIDYVITNGIKMKDWDKPSIYDKFLGEYIRKEPVKRALERSIIEMDKWAQENNTEFTNFFEYVHPVEAVYLIKSGRISPWIIYISDNSSKLLSSFNQEQVKMLANIMDVNLWNFVFHKKVDDVKYARDIISAAGL